MNNSHNVLIIGAGPSGLTLATELTRRGIACTIVDKAAGPAPLHESRALAFNARSQTLLAPCGVAEQIINAGHRIERVRLCWNGNLRKEISMPDAPLQSIVIMRQGEVERHLIQHLNVQGVQVRWNTELIEFSQNESAVTAALQTAGGQITQATAAYMAGCDGAHSQVRKQGGYSFDGESDMQRWTLADAVVEGSEFAHTLTADLRPGKAFATIPMGDNIVRLIHNGPDILECHPMAQHCRDVQWESEFKVSYRLVKQYHRGRTFLCGDAAHIHSPVGGRGMNLGIEDAATLAWLLETGSVENYTAQRLPVAKKVLKLTHSQTTQMNSSSPVVSLAKKYGPKLMSLPKVRGAFLNTVLGLDTAEPAWFSGASAELK